MSGIGTGMPKDNAVIGDRISKEYRDRYANFSKGAHFTLGGQDGNKMSQTTSAFYEKGTSTYDKKSLHDNIKNMRGTHFSVGMNSQNHMTPAPYKVSNPAGAEKVKSIDKNLLGRESWILGQCPETYKTVSQMAFLSPRRDSQGAVNDKAAARALKQRVAGTSIKNEPDKSPDGKMLGYQTNNSIVHKSLGAIQPVDKEMQKAARDKLTRANFSMGKQSPYYNTTNKSAFYPMRGQAHSQDQRKKAVDNNRRTNFISMADGGFEAPQKKFDFASVPDKGRNDSSKVQSMIDNLKKEHFKLGEQNYPMQRTSASIGATNSGKKEHVPWAHLRTNYALGIDDIPKTTDYQNRFAQTTSNFRDVGNPFNESLKNKTKMTSDSVVIAATNRFDSTVSSKTQFQNRFNASRAVNTGLDKLTTSYITGSHFKPGYGGFSGQSENKRAFMEGRKGEQASLSPDRIAFFKDTHFDHANRQMRLDGNTSMQQSFYERDLSGRATINNGNNAWSLRHKIHDYGKIGQQSAQYVTDDQMRYKWVQPNNKDPGPTASMGLINKE